MTRAEKYVAGRLERRAARRAFRAGWNELQLAARMAYLRQQRRLTQTQLAARMHTSPAVISRLEAGKLGSVRTLKRYAEAVGVLLKIDFLEPTRRKTVR